MGSRLVKPKEKMLPCPFCGHEAHTTYGAMGNITLIMCGNYRNCGATVSFDNKFANQNGEAASIRLWNQRTKAVE